MSNVTIFKQPGALSTNRKEPTELGRSLAASVGTTRRIQTNTNGTFRRTINGEPMGKAVSGAIDVIIVGALPKVSRVFYAKQYDPNAKATLPDCWSNLGDYPEGGASNAQSNSCVACPQNVVGSGSMGKGRACRYQRRIAILLAGDASGDVYQFNIPAKSLFGKGVGNTHPFESYTRFLLSNHESPDTVVTTIAYDTEADSMELNFTPVRGLSDEEYELVQAAQADPDTERYVQLTVAAASRVVDHPVLEKPAAKPVATPSQGSLFDDDDDEEEAAPVAEPKRRAPKKPAAATPASVSSLADALADWDAEDAEVPF